MPGRHWAKLILSCLTVFWNMTGLWLEPEVVLWTTTKKNIPDGLFVDSPSPPFSVCISICFLYSNCLSRVFTKKQKFSKQSGSTLTDKREDQQLWTTYSWFLFFEKEFPPACFLFLCSYHFLQLTMWKRWKIYLLLLLLFHSTT